FRSCARARPRASSRIAWSMNRLRFPFFVTRSSNCTVALGNVMLRRSRARVDAFMRTIRMLHTAGLGPQGLLDGMAAQPSFAASADAKSTRRLRDARCRQRDQAVAPKAGLGVRTFLALPDAALPGARPRSARVS